jgi:hypothetical protein
MAPPPSAVWDAVNARACEVAFRLRLLEQLYVGGSRDPREAVEKRLEIMSRAAPDFFGIVREVLVDSVLLSLAVLYDPARSRVRRKERENLSIERLIDAARQHLGNEASSDAAIRSLTTDLETLRQSVEEIRMHRNRRIAHADLESQLNPNEELPPVLWADLKSVVRHTYELLNKIQDVLEPGHSTAYEASFLLGCGESLTYVLDRGLRFDELEIWLWEQGLDGAASDLRENILGKFFEH